MLITSIFVKKFIFNEKYKLNIYESLIFDMPNTFFRFKQFIINQEQAAMKVSTDACILGAYTAKCYAEGATNILDIGSGTGLLSVMLAQKSQCPITAVEIDEGAFEQTKINFAQSPWAARLQVFHASIQDFAVQHASNQYNLLICNPPFFVNSLKSVKKEKNLARHTDSLSFRDLIGCANKLSSEQAHFTVLLPIKESELFEKELVSNGFDFYISERLQIQDNLNKLPHRVILTLEKMPKHTDLIKEIKNKSLIVKDLNGNYTSELAGLMREYYLTV